METKRIKLSGIQDALEFVTAAESCDFNVDLLYDRIIIDGKSMIGVCSLDLSHIITVSYDGHNQRFDTILEKFQAA